jgi:hypothetical protein
MISETVMEHQTTMPVREHLYSATLRLTGSTEYGISLQDIYSGRMRIPPQGIRVDLPFEGVLRGEKINGAIRGVDYGVMRADGRFDLNLQAEITTDDGEKIAFHATGIFADVDTATGIGQVRENVQLSTASAKYVWVNQLQIWATGVSNIALGELMIDAYVA